MREGFELGVLLFRYQDAPAKRVPEDLQLASTNEIVKSGFGNLIELRCSFNRQHEIPVKPIERLSTAL